MGIAVEEKKEFTVDTNEFKSSHIDLQIIEQDTKIEELKTQISQSLTNLETKLFKVSGNKNYSIKQLNSSLNYVNWMCKKFALRRNKEPKIIQQREIFYCELGINLGSEQGLKRPVVILQNNIGNKMGNTTIIAPITTYEHSEFYEKNNKYWVKYVDDNDTLIDRPLDFYEIPIKIEPNYTHLISGIVNIIHIKEISKKRLFQTPVAIITIDNYNDIIKAINYNLSVL